MIASRLLATGSAPVALWQPQAPQQTGTGQHRQSSKQAVAPGDMHSTAPRTHGQEASAATSTYARTDTQTHGHADMQAHRHACTHAHTHTHMHRHAGNTPFPARANGHAYNHVACVVLRALEVLEAAVVLVPGRALAIGTLGPRLALGDSSATAGHCQGCLAIHRSVWPLRRLRLPNQGGPG